jgi:rubrerythrin
MANYCQVVCISGTSSITAGLPWTDTTDGNNPVVVQCNYVYGTGRRPAGLAQEARPARFVAELLASQAYLERASVDAFLELAEQVTAHGAPAKLVERLRRAACEEVEHARVVGELARARGCEPVPVDVTPAGPRSLLAIALENAREGCVRETWGAAVAVAQGERAGDGEVRKAMEQIALDELGHAALSWDLAAWLETRLSGEERAAVAEERARAVAELEGEIAQEVPSAWRAALGVPSQAESVAIFAGMRETVWASHV